MDADLDRMLRRVLRPLIAMLMRRGVGYIALRDLLKKIYVEEALRQQPAEASPTDSSVSLVTGINRREVKRLREEAAHPADQNRHLHTARQYARRRRRSRGESGDRGAGTVPDCHVWQV